MDYAEKRRDGFSHICKLNLILVFWGACLTTVVTPKSSSSDLLALLNSKLGSHISASALDLGDVVISIRREAILDIFKILKLDSQLQFNYLVDITVVDWMDNRPDRFEVVYHLMSLAHGHRLRIKAAVPEQDPTIESVVSLWRGANFMEREAWDMYGVVFKNHGDLRRILMYDEFKGYPLRKDYPVQGKQPRVALRSPEVSNTARDMNRPELVKIRARAGSEKRTGA